MTKRPTTGYLFSPFLSTLALLCSNLLLAQTVAPQIEFSWQIDHNESWQSDQGSRLISLADYASPQGASPQKLHLQLLKSMDELDSLVLYQQQQRVLNLPLYRADISGLCLTANTGKLAFFIDSIDEGLGLYYRHVLTQDQAKQWRLATIDEALEPFESDQNPFVTCQQNQGASWQQFRLQGQACQCNFANDPFALSEEQIWQSIIPHELSISQLADEAFMAGKSKQLRLEQPADIQAFERLLGRAQQTPGYQIETYTDGDSKLVNVVYRSGVLQNFAYSVIYHQQHWYLWDVAGNSSKGFYPVQHIKGGPAGKIQFEACIDDCSWWGRYGELELDLTSLQIKLLAEETE